MFSFMQRVVKTRDGKVYAGEPTDFEDQGSVVIYHGFLNIFRHHIHTEQISEDYTTISPFGYFSGLLVLLVFAIGLLSLNSPEALEDFTDGDALMQMVNIDE